MVLIFAACRTRSLSVNLRKRMVIGRVVVWLLVGASVLGELALVLWACRWTGGATREVCLAGSGSVACFPLLFCPDLIEHNYSFAPHFPGPLFSLPDTLLSF